MQVELEEIRRLERNIKKNPKIQEKRAGISSAMEDALKGFKVTFVDTDDSVFAFGEMVAVFSTEDAARHYVKIREIIPRLILAAQQIHDGDSKILSDMLDDATPKQKEVLWRIISAATILEN